MLLSSILSILDQNQVQLKTAEQRKAPVSGLEKIELEIAAAAELVKPSEMKPQPAGTPSTGPFFEELLRAITKFEKAEPSRVVDFFE